MVMVPLNTDSDPLFNESDRGCVIVGVATLDSILVDYLRDALKKNGLSNRYVAKVFDGNGALGTFSSKVQIARGFSLISEDVFHDLMILRKLRNDFAHGRHSCSFADEKVRAQISSMMFVQRQRGMWEQSLDRASIIERLKSNDVVIWKWLFCLTIKDIHIAMLEARFKYVGGDVNELLPVRPSQYLTTQL